MNAIVNLIVGSTFAPPYRCASRAVAAGIA
jgi:hypothetical protein